MKKILIAVLAVVILLVGTGGFYYAKVYANPYNRTAIAVAKSMNATNQDITCNMKFALDPEKYEESTGMTLYDDEKAMMLYVNSLLDKTAFELNYKQAINKKNPIDSKFQYALNWLYNEEKLLDFMVGMDEEYFEVLMPSIMNKTFFVSKDDIYKQMDLDLKDFDFEKYFKIIRNNRKLLKAVDQDVYLDILKDTFKDKIKKGDSVNVVMSDGKKVKCREYIVEMQYEDTLNIMKDMISEMEDDEAIKEYIRVTTLEVLEELKDSKDYKAFKIEKNHIEEITEYFENEDDFEDVYEEMIVALNEMIDELETVSDEVNVDYNVTYAIDIKNDIRAMKMDMDYGFIKVDYDYVMNSIGRKIDFASYEDNERIDIMTLMEKDEDELYDMAEEIIIDAGDKVIANKALDSMLKDMKKNSDLLPSEYSAMLGTYIDEFQNNKGTFIQDLIDTMLYSMKNPYSYDYEEDVDYEDYDFEDLELDYDFGDLDFDFNIEDYEY
ncbi:MAG: hypothetical protein CVV02_07515 [Firmicutes bacterium HGW-Firmicutes-7]|nr:MAG: hypothetical protein CVV02_07515 [Firmicutes bacterium HGW-Firmicutes-7]